MTTTTCDRCGQEVTYHEHPFCPHGFGKGMLGRFQGRDLNLGNGTQHFTSLAELRRAERKAGLEPIQPHEWDRVKSIQEQSRRIMAERQQATERQRHDAIGNALRQHRRG